MVLALAGGSPGDVTALFAALALFRAPYMLALGMVAQLTTWVTPAVVAGDLPPCARMRVRLRLATLVTSPWRGAGAALLGPSLLPLVFGPDVTLAAVRDRAGRRRLCPGRGQPGAGRERPGPGTVELRGPVLAR